MSNLSSEEKSSIIVSTLIGLLGYIISVFTNDDIFPRFGALIVCVGIYFTMRGFSHRIDDSSRFFKNNLDKLISETLNYFEQKKDLVPKDIYEKEKQNFLSKIEASEKETMRELHELKMRLIRVEGAIIIAGTLIWAFGDWIVY